MLNSLSQALRHQKFPIDWAGHLIDNQWIQDGRPANSPTSESKNPNNSQVLARTYLGPDVAEQALESSYRTWDKTLQTNVESRAIALQQFADCLIENQDLIRKVLQTETGRPAWDAQEEIAKTMRFVKWFADNELMDMPSSSWKNASITYNHRSRGVILAYPTFSNPVEDAATAICLAIRSGSPILMHFSHANMLLGAIIAETARESLAEHPGWVNVLFSTFSVFHQHSRDRRVATVIYTGSNEHCHQIVADHNSYSRRLILNSGGKNAVIVHSSADIPKAVNGIVYGMIKSCGQLCTSTRRVFVYRSKLEDTVIALKEALTGLNIGRTDDLADHVGPDLGPLYSLKSLERFMNFQTIANRETAEALVFGRPTLEDTQGYFVTPSAHLTDDPSTQSTYMTTNLMAPDVVVSPYDVLEDALTAVVDTSALYVLSFYGDEDAIKKRVISWPIPNVMVNLPTVPLEANLPMAGITAHTLHQENGHRLLGQLQSAQAIICNNGKDTRQLSKDRVPPEK